MEQAHNSPGRITDLVALKQKGASVECRVSFDILPVEFSHRQNPFRAHIFLGQYEGSIDGRTFAFRKCYARGCPNNLCPHVSQAVMIANRYLQRDYAKLEKAGIVVARNLFTLEEMMVKFEGAQEAKSPLPALHDYLTIAGEGHPVFITVCLESVPAVEHFANHQTPMVFLMVDFAIACLGATHHFERCLACYPVEAEAEQKPQKVSIANERLKLLYTEFDQAGIQHNREFFV